MSTYGADHKTTPLSKESIEPAASFKREPSVGVWLFSSDLSRLFLCGELGAVGTIVTEQVEDVSFVDRLAGAVEEAGLIDGDYQLASELSVAEHTLESRKLHAVDPAVVRQVKTHFYAARGKAVRGDYYLKHPGWYPLSSAIKLLSESIPDRSSMVKRMHGALSAMDDCRLSGVPFQVICDQCSSESLLTKVVHFDACVDDNDAGRTRQVRGIARFECEMGHNWYGDIGSDPQ
jgi:hypothetical protein